MLMDTTVGQLIEWFGVDRTDNRENYWTMARARVAWSTQVAGVAWNGVEMNFNEPVNFGIEDRPDTPGSHPINLDNFPAIVGVESENPVDVNGVSSDHCVIWCPNRKMILDPNYDQPQKLSKYRVKEWYPLSKILNEDPVDGFKEKIFHQKFLEKGLN
jgi:hypothetical protein